MATASASARIRLAYVAAQKSVPPHPSGLRITRPRTWPARRSAMASGAASSGRTSSGIGGTLPSRPRADHLVQLVEGADVGAADRDRALREERHGERQRAVEAHDHEGHRQRAELMRPAFAQAAGEQSAALKASRHQTNNGDAPTQEISAGAGVRLSGDTRVAGYRTEALTCPRRSRPHGNDRTLGRFRACRLAGNHTARFAFYPHAERLGTFRGCPVEEGAGRVQVARPPA